MLPKFASCFATPGILHWYFVDCAGWCVVASVVSLDPAEKRRGEDSQSLDTKLKLMAHIKLEMEALMAQIKTKTHTIQQYNTISDSNWHCNGIQT